MTLRSAGENSAIGGRSSIAKASSRMLRRADRWRPGAARARRVPRPAGKSRANAPRGASLYRSPAGTRRPDRAVGAVTGSVPGDAQHRRRKSVFGHASRDMGQMMLHAGDFRSHLVRQPAGGVIGMQIAHHQTRGQPAQFQHVVNGAAMRLARCDGFQIARCWLSRTASSSVTATVVFRCPPSARMPEARPSIWIGAGA